MSSLKKKSIRSYNAYKTYRTLISAGNLYAKIYQDKLWNFPIQWNPNLEKFFATRDLRVLKYYIISTLFCIIFEWIWNVKGLVNILSITNLNERKIFGAIRKIVIIFATSFLLLYSVIEYWLNEDLCGSVNELMRLRKELESCK